MTETDETDEIGKFAESLRKHTIEHPGETIMVWVASLSMAPHISRALLAMPGFRTMHNQGCYIVAENGSRINIWHHSRRRREFTLGLRSYAEAFYPR